MEPKDCIAAKTGYFDERPGWLPLWMHSCDTAGIMVKLIVEWIPEAVLLSIGLNQEILKKTAYFLGLTHDFGKMTSGFQSAITKKLPRYSETT